MRYNHFSMLPEQAFNPRSKVFTHGGMTLEGGDGGGGQAQPTSTSTTTIPEYAKPYVERLLGKAEAASEAPYQTYGGERLTGPTQEQLAARQGVAGLQQPGQFGAGTELAAMGGLGALGFGGQAAQAGQNYMGLATSPQAQQAFMSPYMQNVVDVQKQEAIRDAQKQNLAGNLGAARQGTYGGARQLLAQTERERNLGSQLAQIQATGSQKAFEAAQQAQQFGSNLGLQGLGQAIGAGGQAAQAGATLGQLGIGQQQQDLARLQAQEQAGALGQREQQAALDLAYQDFLAQQRYPYSQLGFMSDILRGSGNLAGTGGQAIYQAPPSTGSQLLGLASSLGGAYLAGGGKFFREGGEVSGLGAAKRYAGGGEVIENMIDVAKLTPEQIEQTKETGARPDVAILLNAALDEKIDEFKRMQQAAAQPQTTTAIQDIQNEGMQIAGLNAIPVPDDYYREPEQLASGGIIAFAGGGMPSMDPGLPYGLGYTNNMGYDGGGVVAFQEGGDTRQQMAAQMAADRAALSQAGGKFSSALSDILTLPARGLGGAYNFAVARPLRAITGADIPYAFQDNPEMVQSLTPYYDKNIRANEPAKEEAKKPEEKKPAPKAEPKVAVSDKTAKKVQKAEDSYEKYLRDALKDADMAESDKNQAIGFALMKAGAKAMSGKSQYALQNIGEGIESGADEYVRYLNQAKKDKKEAQKSLVEYGLAKEKLGLEREKIAATERNTAAQIEGRGATANQKFISDLIETYNKSPLINTPGTKTYEPLQVYLKRRLDAIRGTVSGGSTPVEGRTAVAADFDR